MGNNNNDNDNDIDINKLYLKRVTGNGKWAFSTIDCASVLKFGNESVGLGRAHFHIIQMVSHEESF